MNPPISSSASLDPRTKELLDQARTLVNRPLDSRLSALAIPLYEKAIQIEPAQARIHVELATVQHQLGLIKEAHTSLQNACKLRPDSIGIQWIGCVLEISLCYRNTDEINVARKAYQSKLKILLDRVRSANNDQLAAASWAVNYAKPFFLPFQNQNDCELQGLYGEIICPIMAATFKDSAERENAPLRANEKIRLGVVSAHIRSHSVWRVILKGWLACLGNEEFELTIYSLSNLEDEETKQARTSSQKFLSGNRSVSDWRDLIIADKQHAIIYPEIGMDAKTLQLAALRLAPFQCATWGHSTTTGLPTIDAFISGEVVEPPDAENHYTEKLIKLPGFSFVFEPKKVEAAQLPRTYFGLKSDSVIYFCAQALWKYLPEHDTIYPEIAQRVPRAQFVFMQHRRIASVTNCFRDRLTDAFNRHGLDINDHVVFLSHLSHAAYQRLSQLSDIVLDSIGYGGWTTILDSLAHNKPIVAMPGEFMRGRFASEALRIMDSEEAVASNTSEFVEIASRLGNDLKWRSEMSDRIKNKKHLVYGNPGDLEGLKSIIRGGVLGSQSKIADDV